MTYIIIAQNNCVFCDRATELLRSHNLHYTYYNLSDNPWLHALIKSAGHRTVPIIFTSEGKHIGGYTELKEYIND